MTEKLNLQNMCQGAISEQFDVALEKVLRNIDDPNTSADEVRSISIEVKFKPDESRETSIYQIGVKTKLAQPEKIKGRVFNAKKGKEHIAFERDPKQMMFEDLTKEKPQMEVVSNA